MGRRGGGRVQSAVVGLLVLVGAGWAVCGRGTSSRPAPDAPSTAAEIQPARPAARDDQDPSQSFEDGAAEGKAIFDALVARYRKFRWDQSMAEISRECPKGGDCNDTAMDALLEAQPMMTQAIGNARASVTSFHRAEPTVRCPGPFNGGAFVTSCPCRRPVHSTCCPKGKSGERFQAANCTK